MKKEKTNIEGLFIITYDVFKDSRGYFFESWNKNKLIDININIDFLQDNVSVSKKNVLRGLHFQRNSFSQEKLVQVLKGKVIDVIVDLRKDSNSFKKHEKIILKENDNKMILIPKGCAHGFISLEDQTIFSYKCSNYYNKKNDVTLNWNDQDIGIDWSIENPIISEKDQNGLSFKELIDKKYI